MRLLVTLWLIFLIMATAARPILGKLLICMLGMKKIGSDVSLKLDLLKPSHMRFHCGRFLSQLAL